MEIPDLVRQQLGDEDLESAVNLGGEDLACFTPSRTLIYRSEGILSDDSLEVYSHDVERVKVSEGRRKTTFTLEYVDRTDSFSVAGDRADPVLERLLGGILQTAGIVDPSEEIRGSYRFSELLLIITDARLVKHVGAYVWDEDYEEYPYSDFTGLHFEEGSVATQIVVSVDGRPHRIKAPSDKAPVVQETLTNALLEFYGVDSLAALTEAIAPGEDDMSDTTAEESHSVTSDLSLDDSITPLVGGSDSEGTDEGSSETGETHPDMLENPTTDQRVSEPPAQSQTHSTDTESTPVTNTETATSSQSPDEAIEPADFKALQDQVETLTTAVQRQNELLTQQHETLRSLVEELQD